MTALWRRLLLACAAFWRVLRYGYDASSPVGDVRIAQRPQGSASGRFRVVRLLASGAVEDVTYASGANARDAYSDATAQPEIRAALFVDGSDIRGRHGDHEALAPTIEAGARR